MGALGARIAAAFNRSTLLSDAQQPDGEQVANYYQTSPTNHYARIVHETNIDNRGYAFPYDDVVPSGATQPDPAGTVFDGSPKLLTVTLGGPASNTPAKPGNGKETDPGTTDPGTGNGGSGGSTSGFWDKVKTWFGELKKFLHIGTGSSAVKKTKSKAKK